MTLHQPAPQVDEEAALAARAAWLHLAGGKTQGEVAEILGVQSTKAHRLIARARAEGLIRVFVEGPISGCIALEEKIKAEYVKKWPALKEDFRKAAKSGDIALVQEFRVKLREGKDGGCVIC